MWACFNNAFVSAVEDTRNPKNLKVRARKREHLERLFPNAEIHTDMSADYRYRVFVPREEFAKLVADRIMNIDYDNFKDSVEDDGLHDLYADFWQLHWRYQQNKRL